MASEYKVVRNVDSRLVNPDAMTRIRHGASAPLAPEGGTIKHFFERQAGEAGAMAGMMGTMAGMSGWALEPEIPTDPSIRTPRRRQSVSLEQVAQRLDRLERLVQGIGTQLQQLLDGSTIATEISEIGDVPLKRPLPIVLQETEGEVLARWPEAGLTGVGDSEGEAIESLREEIAITWRELESTVGKKLSRHAQTIRQVMANYADAAS